MFFESKQNFYEQTPLRKLGGGWLRPGGETLTQNVVALSSLKPGARVLDLGCGTGATVRRLATEFGFHAVGMDPSMLLLHEGREKHGDAPVMRAAGEFLPIAAGAMDGVLAECSLSATRDVDRVLGECFRVLGNHGVLLIHDVYARNPEGVPDIARLPLKTCMKGAVSRATWTSRLENHGFCVRVWEDRSVVLKEFAARLIFACGSLDAFWECGRSDIREDETADPQRILSKTRPGYFLLMAHKVSAGPEGKGAIS